MIDSSPTGHIARLELVSQRCAMWSEMLAWQSDGVSCRCELRAASDAILAK